MPCYVALLRAVNVGGHNVKMITLLELFEALGFSSVATVIASGNVLFEAKTDNIPLLERQIEAQLLKALGYPVGAFVRTGPQLAAVVAYPAFAATAASETSPIYVSFLHEDLSEDARARVLALSNDIDEFHVHHREIYWKCKIKMSGSAVFKRGLLDKAVRVPSTSRNMNTVKKLALKLAK